MKTYEPLLAELDAAHRDFLSAWQDALVSHERGAASAYQRTAESLSQAGESLRVALAWAHLPRPYGHADLPDAPKEQP